LHYTVLPALRRERHREYVKRFRFWVELLVRGDYGFSTTLKPLASAPENLGRGHVFVLRGVDAVHLLVEHRTDEKRDAGGNGRSNGVERLGRQNTPIRSRTPASPTA